VRIRIVFYFLPLLLLLKKEEGIQFDKLKVFRRLLDATVKFAVCSQMNRQSFAGFVILWCQRGQYAKQGKKVKVGEVLLILL